ncbi:digestive cysteine proteinase 1-like [Saccostrea echinata]|uniref:digestive cysteine proteinase 1-like n=1 Tax=Saccostrea echinata TaxID=191078 RepID=UPI002A7F67EF|nr:digestive cysteine proteinase 1-like [Saccostrea echinata]
MAVGRNVFAVLLVKTVLAASLTKDAPTWGDSYSVDGVLQLPYAELKEPFRAYYDAKNNQSRIDYYNDLVITMQLQTQNISIKIAYMTTETVTNQKTCFLVNGSSPIQAVLPDLSDFKNVGQDTIGATTTDKWVKVTNHGKKKSTYTMWVDSATNAPVRYEMMGYDSLLGSHYDKYYLDYSNFKNETSFNATVFNYTSFGLSCSGFPGPGFSERKVLMNPMVEYIHNYDNHVEEMFIKHKQKHAPKYSSIKEHAQRQHIFRQNVRFIHSKNRAALGFSLAVNHLADKSKEEIQLMNGYRYTPGHHGGLAFDTSKYSVKDIPDTMDWRLHGAVTPVKDQAVCGSCWSFGTTGTIEGAYFLKTGNLVRLSQQQLMDCSWGEGNNACDGGEDFRAYDWIMKNGGLTSEELYGPYLAQDGMCNKTITPVAKLKNYVNVTSGDLQALKFAIAHQGPISVAIDASHLSLSFYANGVYYEPQCGNKPDDLDHSVLAVGYGVMNGQAYWLIKNSWSTYWGNDGYVLMSQKDNNCGVATDPTFVLM